MTIGARVIHPGLALPGTVVASELRDGVPWLVVELDGHGTHIAPATDFEAEPA